MRYKFLYSLLLIPLSACSFNVQVVSPEPNVTSTSSAQPLIETVAVTPPPLLLIPTTTDNPTDVFIATKSAAGNVPTETPQNIGTTIIQFPSNGTYIDVTDSLPANQSKTYSVAALKGQVMSVSINQGFDEDWTVIPLQITGADGTVLCSPIVFNTECYFWRGVLPSPQTYFIKLMPATKVSNFSLRVAIDPPGTTSQVFQYVSPQRDARFTYQDDFAPARFPGPILGRVDSQFTLQLIDSLFYYKTNLVEAYLLFGSSDDNGILANCTQPVDFAGGEQVTGKVMINSHEFVRTDGSGAGAGNTYVNTAYRAVINGSCYEIIFYYHYGNIGNYDPSLGIKEFDNQALTKRFEAILATLTIP